MSNYERFKNYYTSKDAATAGSKLLAVNYAILRDPYYSDSVQRWVVEYAEEES